MIRFNRATFPFVLAVLAACAPPPASSPTPVSSSGEPSPAFPAATPTALLSAPTSQPSSPELLGVTGVVYDIAGKALPMASVRLEINNPAPHEPRLPLPTPFPTHGNDYQVWTGADGRYAFGRHVLGTTATVAVEKDGYTSRSRTFTFGNTPQTLDFGGDTATARAYFLSNYFEITATTPKQDATLDSGTDFKIQLRLSKPLDAENRALFDEALRLLPANNVAANNEGVEDVTAAGIGLPFQRVAEALGSYVISTATRFRGQSLLRGKVVWEADNQTATFSYGGPLLAGRGNEARYQVVLAAGTTPIRATDGTLLGTGASGKLGSVANRAEVLLGVFRDPDGELHDVPGIDPYSQDGRWASTHRAGVSFRLANDRRFPHLVGVRVLEENSDTVLQLAFDEPLAAHDGSDDGKVGAGTGAVAGDLAGITFMVGKRTELVDHKLDGNEPDHLIDPRTQESLGLDAGDRGFALAFDEMAWTPTKGTHAKGTVSISVDKLEPRALRVTVHGRSRFFDRVLERLMVRVEGVGDPAGNLRSEADADGDVVSGDF